MFGCEKLGLRHARLPKRKMPFPFTLGAYSQQWRITAHTAMFQVVWERIMLFGGRLLLAGVGAPAFSLVGGAMVETFPHINGRGVD